MGGACTHLEVGVLSFSFLFLTPHIPKDSGFYDLKCIDRPEHECILKVLYSYPSLAWTGAPLLCGDCAVLCISPHWRRLFTSSTRQLFFCKLQPRARPTPQQQHIRTTLSGSILFMGLCQPGEREWQAIPETTCTSS